MENKKILVTGGCGFIGSNFINYVLDTFNDVSIYNVDYLGHGSDIKNIKNMNDRRHQLFTLDISEPLPNFNTEFDYVFHFAAESHVDRSIEGPKPFIDSNITGTLNVLEFCKNEDNGSPRIIMVSTDEVYGSLKRGSAGETFPLNPSSAYSASKVGAEMLCNAYKETFGLDIIITRCSNNFGPNQFKEKLIPKIIHNAKNNIKIPVYDEGLQVREWTFVDDHNKDILFLAENGKSGEIYNVGRGFESTNIFIVKTILEKLDKPESLIEFVPNARLGHDFRYSISLDKLSKLKGEKILPLSEEEFKEHLDSII